MKKTYRVPLASHTSFKIGAKAGELIQLSSHEDLRAAAAHAHTHQLRPVILGGGTNILCPDTDLLLVWQLQARQPWYTHVDNTTIDVWAGNATAGLAWALIQASLGGFEKFVTLPGTIGGAVWGNAHAGGELISQHVVCIEVYDYQQDQFTWLTADQLTFSYDTSLCQDHPEWVITTVRLCVNPGQDVKKLQAEARSWLTQKHQTQDTGECSAGCFWQNPPNTDALRAQFPEFADREFFPAGFLIEQIKPTLPSGGPVACGRHCSYLVNRDQATQESVLAYARLIQKAIHAHFGVTLVPEVIILRPDGSRDWLPIAEN